MPSPLSGIQTEEQDGVSDDEDRNELFAILQEASSDEQEDTQEDDDNDVNVDVEMEEDTMSQFTGNKYKVFAVTDILDAFFVSLNGDANSCSASFQK